METVRTAVIGTGFSATSHLEALQRVPNVEVIAIMGRSIKKAETLAEQFNIPYTYHTISELKNHEEIDVVHNCTPNFLHYSINKELIESGKHVLSEKPLALNSKESAELQQLAVDKNVVNGVCFNYRHYPLVNEAKAGLANGLHGKVHMVHGGYVQDWCLQDTDYSWRMDRSINGPSRAVADIGSHWCDTVQFILGKKIIRVFADLHTIYDKRKKSTKPQATFSNEVGSDYEEIAIDTEDAGTVLVHFEDGIKGVFTVSQVSAGRKNKLYFDICSRLSTISWDQEKSNELWIGKRDKANEVIVKDPAILSKEARRFTQYPGGHQEGWPDGLKNLFVNFYEHVRNPENTDVDYARFEDGHQIMKVIDAIIESDKTQQWVGV